MSTQRVEFRLTMPKVASWDGRWSDEDRYFAITKRLGKRDIAKLGLSEDRGRSWSYNWDDGWSARIYARIVPNGERVRKSEGFCGYDWMVDSILMRDEIVSEWDMRHKRGTAAGMMAILALALSVAACSDSATAPASSGPTPTLRLYATAAEAEADTITWYLAQGNPYRNVYVGGVCHVARVAVPDWYPAAAATISGWPLWSDPETRWNGDNGWKGVDGETFSQGMTLRETDLMFSPGGVDLEFARWGNFAGAVRGVFRNRTTGALAWGADSFRCVER